MARCLGGGSVSVTRNTGWLAEVNGLPAITSVGSTPEFSAAVAATTNANFIVANDAFLEIIGPNPKLEPVYYFTKDRANEAPSFIHSTQELYFVGNRFPADATHPTEYVETWKYDPATNTSTLLPQNPDIILPNGSATYIDDEGDEIIVFTTNGVNKTVAGLTQWNPKTNVTTILLNNYRGLNFNSPNDLTIAANGGIFFTDPPFGTGSFKAYQDSPPLVYYFNPKTGVLKPVAGGFDDFYPNGAAISADGNHIYLTDTYWWQGPIGIPLAPNGGKYYVWKYDLINKNTDDVELANRRLFAYGTTTTADGIKVDTLGNVYGAVGDGVDVWNQNGVYLGKIQTPGTACANLVLANPGEIYLTCHLILYRATISPSIQGVYPIRVTN